MPFCKSRNLEPGLIAGALFYFQSNPVCSVDICDGFEPTGLKVDATPNKLIGVLDEATGEVLFEWNGDRRALYAAYEADVAR